MRNRAAAHEAVPNRPNVPKKRKSRLPVRGRARIAEVLRRSPRLALRKSVVDLTRVALPIGLQTAGHNRAQDPVRAVLPDLLRTAAALAPVGRRAHSPAATAARTIAALAPAVRRAHSPAATAARTIAALAPAVRRAHSPAATAARTIAALAPAVRRAHSPAATAARTIAALAPAVRRAHSPAATAARTIAALAPAVRRAHSPAATAARTIAALAPAVRYARSHAETAARTIAAVGRRKTIVIQLSAEMQNARRVPAAPKTLETAAMRIGDPTDLLTRVATAPVRGCVTILHGGTEVQATDGRAHVRATAV